MERFTILYIRFSGKSRPSHKKIETLMDGSTFFVVSCLREPAVDYSIAMNRTKNKLLAVGLSIAALLSACQKDSLTGRLELTAEGMGGNGIKMTVSDLHSYWQEGDKVNINGEEATIAVSGTSMGRIGGEVVNGAEVAYVDGEFSADEYYIVFPSSIYQSRTGNIVTLDMPSTYQFSQARILNGNNSLGQVLNAPMAYWGDAAGGRVTLRHLTGALNVQISGPSGIVIDRIIVGTTQNRVMSGPMTFDLSDIDGVSSSATNATANNTVTMIGGKLGTVQIPIPVLTGDVNFTVRVEAHKEGTKYTFERTQAAGGHLGRGVMGVVSVDLNEGQTGVTTSALFPTTIIGGKTYYQISTPQDFQLMSNAICGTEYREDGDSYTRRWEYNSLKYMNANYYVTNDIDMSGIYFTAIEGFGGEFNGGNHTISNLTVTGTADLEWPVYWGVFATCYGSTVSFKNITFDNLIVKTRNSIDNQAYCGAIVGWLSADCSIDNVTVNGFREVNYYGNTTSNHHDYCLGGFVGRLNGTVDITNSSVTFAADQEFTHKSGGVVNIGGIVGQVYNNSASILLNSVSVNFGTMDFNVGNATRRFGGIINDSYYYNNVTAVNTTIIGNITFSSGSNIAGLVSPGYDTKAGVDVSGLTITQN